MEGEDSSRVMYLRRNVFEMHVPHGKLLREVLKLATSVLDAFRAVVGMVRKDDLQGVAPQVQKLFASGLDAHAVLTGGGTGTHSAAIDLHHAHAAVSKGGQVFMIAQMRHWITALAQACNTLVFLVTCGLCRSHTQ
jgi:hypothetical protein